MSAASFAQVSIAIRIGPPALPVYEQPICPAEGYIWTPGYWAYDYDYNDYYWVPGTWVLAPEVGYLWTPAWWGWGGDRFLFHEGYWGPRVGFYGGINYGFGYFGNGYEGGRWDHDHFYYNRSVNNVNVTNIHNVYNTTVINNNVTRVSYNGGQGGINARPTPEQTAAEHERHLPPVPVQREHIQAARGNQELRASVNHGKPPVAATPRPAEFNRGVPAKEAGAPYRPEQNRPAEQAHGNAPRPGGEAPRPGGEVPRPPTHAADIQPHQRPAPPNTGNPKTDQKYQQQQDKLYARQQQEHQHLQQQQEQDHQRIQQQQARASQQQANNAKAQQAQQRVQQQQQQMEQRHQQQTQQMEQRHTQQQQHLQQRQQPPNHQQPPNRGEPGKK
jgi:hypothetical protein